MQQDHQEQQWLDWVEQLRAIAQNGLAYADGHFDIERYHQLQTIAHDMTALLSGAPRSKVDRENGYTTPIIPAMLTTF